MNALFPLSKDQQASQLHLLRLVSQGLPVGGFAYSRGLEAVVAAGWVCNEETARDWIQGTLHASIAHFDGALLWRMAMALQTGDRERFRSVNAWLAAGRESRELQREDKRMGEVLLRLLVDLDVPAASAHPDVEMTFPGAFAIAAHHWNIAPIWALKGLMWIYVEGQVTAAIRLVPLGHTAGQRILTEATGWVEDAAIHATSIGDDDVGNLVPALAMASAWHETQYSRLFQS